MLARTRAVRFALSLLLLTPMLPSAPHAGYSPDDAPAETPLDPGHVFRIGGTLEVDDACPPLPPFPAPCLGVPDPINFDLDAFSIDEGRRVCPGGPPPAEPGILFSFDDGDPGAGSGTPDLATELFFYDRCNLRGGGSYFTNATESFLGLGGDPPPAAADDDVDAYETADAGNHWGGGGLLFSPDDVKPGGLGANPACPPGKPFNNVYRSDANGSAAFWADACTLGVPDPDNCDIDALTLVVGEDAFPLAPVQVLFSTDAALPCGLDPGDAYISDNAGTQVLWADDVTDLRIAVDESDPVDLDALSVNADGPIGSAEPFVPGSRFFWKRGWPDWAENGVPDFSQDHAAFPSTFCGPTALADAFWWLDSKFEGRCAGGPGDGVDDYPLVETYPGNVDDHEPANAEPLIQDLSGCMLTDPVFGTRPSDMKSCIDGRLAGIGQSALFHTALTHSPSFGQIACAVEESNAVILALGFWNGPASRCGGHFVTVAGVQRTRDPGLDGAPGLGGADDDGDGVIDEDDELCPCGAGGPVALGDDVCVTGPDDRLAISDPGLNNAESGGPGRVLGPAHFNHAPVAAPPPDHDDAQNVSHDRYDAGPSGTGLYTVGLPAYGTPDGSPTPCEAVQRWCGQNPNEENPLEEPCLPGMPIQVEVENMLTVGPLTTDLCLDVRSGLGKLLVHKGACPAPASVIPTYDYVRGELCQVVETATQIDLGVVDGLADDSSADQFPHDDSWDVTQGIGAWFFLAREDVLGCDYGTSSSAKLRWAGAGDPVCP